MTYEARVKELEALFKELPVERPVGDEPDFTFFVLHGDRARVVGTRWYRVHLALYGFLVTLEDGIDEIGTKTLICRRPKCKHCSLKYSDHQPHGGACLFGSTNYTEPPL